MIIKTLAIDLKSVSIISVVLHPRRVKTDMSGANALISTTESVTGMRNVISRLALADPGKFIAYNGNRGKCRAAGNTLNQIGRAHCHRCGYPGRCRAAGFLLADFICIG